MNWHALVLALTALPIAGWSNDRWSAFISDTHFGVGKAPGNRWHPYEDARWAEDFSRFLLDLDRRGGGKTDLVINGDMFELWQTLKPGDCVVRQNRDLGCTESAARERLNRALAQHGPEMAALARFASAGENHVAIVPGNHDVALMFKSLADRVIAAIGAPSGKVSVEHRGYWTSDDRRIVAEHGHQIGADPNSFKNKWPKPFTVWKGRTYLDRPWGEQFVQEFFDPLERKYPILDNFENDLDGRWYVTAVEGPTALKHIARFLQFAVLQVSWKQAGDLGVSDSPEYDIEAIREQRGKFLVDSLPAGDPLRTAAVDSTPLDPELFTAELIAAICDSRKERGVSECPSRFLGAEVKQSLTVADLIFARHASTMRNELSRSFDLLVYSHTHKALPSFRPRTREVLPEPLPLFINTGAWQRVVTLDQMKAIQTKRGLTDKQVLSLGPEDLPACYGMVLVPPYSDTLAPELRYWNGKTLEEQCQ